MEFRKSWPMYAIGTAFILGFIGMTVGDIKRTSEKNSLTEKINPIATFPNSSDHSSPSIVKGDFNKDGYDDLAIVQAQAKNNGWRYPDTKVYVFYNDGKGNFSTTNNYKDK